LHPRKCIETQPALETGGGESALPEETSSISKTISDDDLTEQLLESFPASDPPSSGRIE